MATKKKITSKIISKPVPAGTASTSATSKDKLQAALKPQSPKSMAVETDEVGMSPDGELRTTRTKKECFFCQKKTSPSYTDLVSLRRFLTDRAKIVSRERSGVCSRHQRAVSKNIKYARHLALLPFVPKV